MEKRGQVAIFIILGILVIVGISLFFIFSGSFLKNAIGGESSEVSALIQSCSEEIYLDLLYEVGLRGGYFEIPVDSISYGVPVYKSGNNLNIARIETIEEEIEKGFNKKLSECTSNFSDITSVKVDANYPSSDVKILDDEVVFSIIYPMSIIGPDKTESIRDFGKINAKIRMGEIQKIASEIILTEDFNEICIGCLIDKAENNDLYIDTVYLDENSLFFIISYEELNGELFEFVFGMRK